MDGVLLYASYLSKSYDVLAIAVSGTDKNNIKVSHYLHLKDESKAFQYFGDMLLVPDDYYSGVNSSDEKKRQDYDKLLDYTRELNSRLHKMTNCRSGTMYFSKLYFVGTKATQFQVILQDRR